MPHSAVANIVAEGKSRGKFETKFENILGCAIQGTWV
jgi:hypothetical protein